MSRACLSNSRKSPDAIKFAALAQAFSGNALIASSAASWQSNSSSCYNNNSREFFTVGHAPVTTLSPIFQIHQPRPLIPQAAYPIRSHMTSYGAHCPDCTCPIRQRAIARHFIAVPTPVLSARIRVPTFTPPPPPPPPPMPQHCSGDLAIRMIQDLNCRIDSELSALQSTVSRNWDSFNASHNDWRAMIAQATEKSDAAASVAGASMSLGEQARDSAEHSRGEVVSLSQKMMSLNSSIANALSQAEAAQRRCEATGQEIRRLDASSHEFRSLLDNLASQMRSELGSAQHELNATRNLARQALDESKNTQKSLLDVRSLAERSLNEAANAARGSQMAQDIAQRVMLDVNSMKAELADSRSLAQKGLANSENALHISQDLKSLLNVVQGQLSETKSELSELKHIASNAAQLAQSTAAETNASKSKISALQNKIDSFNSRLENAEGHLAGFSDEIRAWKMRTIEAAKFVDSSAIRSR